MMAGFMCCDSWIDDETKFKRHVLKTHFGGRKTDVYQSGNMLCPIKTCQTSVCKAWIREHFKLVHPEKVPFLMKTSKPPFADKAPQQAVPAFTSQLPTLASSSQLPNLTSTFQSPQIDSHPCQGSSVADELWPLDDDFGLSDVPPLSALDLLQDSAKNLAVGQSSDKLIEPPVYIDQWKHFLDLTSSKELNDLLCAAKAKTKATEKAITTILGLSSAYFGEQFRAGKLSENTFELFDKMTSSFYHVNKDKVHDNKSLKIYHLSPANSLHTLQFHFISIINLVKQLASSPAFMHAILKEKHRSRDANIISSFRDGTLCGLEQSENSTTIYLQLFFDDFNKFKDNFYKTSAVYSSILNLPYFNQSGRDELLLLLVFKRIITKFALVPSKALASIFKCLIEELDHLAKVGIPLSDGSKLFVKLIHFSGDNLALNELMNITRCFTKDACRYCTVHYNDLQDPNSLSGVCLNRGLPVDHIFNFTRALFLYCPDIFHDLFESGVIHKLINRILKNYYKRADLINLDNKISQLRWTNGAVKVNRSSSEISSSKGAAVQEFFYQFPLLDQVTPRESKDWKCYLLLRSIVNFFSAPSVRRESVEDSRLLVREFQSLFYELYVTPGQETFTFKLHHLSHYPDLMLIFGPLLHCSAWRYERFHQRHLEFLRSSRSTINVEFSMAKNFLQLFKLDLDKDEITFSSNSITNADKQKFRRFSELLKLDEKFRIVKTAIIQKTLFKPEKVFVFKCSPNDLPVFCQVNSIFEQNEKLIVVCKEFQTLRFDRKIGCYCVKPIERFVSIDPYNLEYCKELDFKSDSNLISKDFHLVSEDLLSFH